MISVTNALKDLIRDIPGTIRQIDEETFNHKSALQKWSKKEILGHLCDSAFNNIQRVIRVQYEETPLFIYDQDLWVKAGNYQLQSREQVLLLWEVLQKQLIEVVENLPAEMHDRRCNVGKVHPEIVPIRFIIEDYVRHQKYHLDQIFK